MRVGIVGAGVVGVATAWWLAEQGHEVVVLERGDGVAGMTSLGNGGQLTPSLAAPWATPTFKRDMWRYAVSRSGPVLLNAVPDRAMLGFVRGMLRASSADSYRASRTYMLALARFSLAQTRALRDRTGIEFCFRETGITVLFRSAASAAAYAAELGTMRDLGIRHRVLAGAELGEVEPNLARDGVVHSGVLLEEDASGDCAAFTRQLARLCEGRGVEFRFGTAVERLRVSGGRVEGAETGRGPERLDAAVLTTGPQINALLAPLGVTMPVYPVKGYGITVEAGADVAGPVASVIDFGRKVTITRLGDRIRSVGYAELAGFSTKHHAPRFENLMASVGELFPGVPREALEAAERWSGLRPVSHDGPPLIGRVGCENLYVNCGHGTLGWTLACGSARLVAELVSDEEPSIALRPVSPRAARQERGVRPRAGRR